MGPLLNRSWLSILVLLLLLSPLAASSDVSPRLIESALLIGDNAAAVHMAKASIAAHPNDQEMHLLLIRTLARAAREDEMLKAFIAMKGHFVDFVPDDELLETMGFCILKRGFSSSNLTVREISLLALAITQDMEGVIALKKALQDGNKAIRATAALLSGFFADGVLKEEIQERLIEEKSSEVRRALYTTIAKLKVYSTLDLLLKRAAEEIYSPKERALILKAIVELSGKLNRQTLEQLLFSRSSLIRAFVASTIAYNFEQQHCDLVEKLLDDYHPEVKKAALAALAMLGKGPTLRLKNLAEDGNDQIAILAAYALFVVDENEGKEAFSHLLKSLRLPRRRLAAAACSALGEGGLELLKSFASQDTDDFMQFYLGLACLQQRDQIDSAGELIFNFLEKQMEPLMEGETSFFSIEKSTLASHPLIDNYRQAADQALRFKLLNLLAIVKHPRAQLAVENFLKAGRWQLVGMAAEILLSEGDDRTLDILQSFLTHPDVRCRRTAALILAALQIESSIEPLKALYRQSHLQDKLMIMEALAGIGSRKLLPFFIDELQSPSQTIRVAAAAMMVRTLRS